MHCIENACTKFVDISVWLIYVIYDTEQFLHSYILFCKKFITTFYINVCEFHLGFCEIKYMEF